MFVRLSNVSNWRKVGDEKVEPQFASSLPQLRLPLPRRQASVKCRSFLRASLAVALSSNFLSHNADIIAIV